MGGILDGFISDVTSRISEFFTGWFDWLFSPLWLWWGIGVGVFIALCAIAFFLPFKWPRAIIGGIILLGGAFLAGGTTMYREMGAKLEEEKRKRKEAEQRNRQTQPRQSGSWFGWVLLLFVLIPQKAEAQYTCAQIRAAHSQYGETVLRMWARVSGVSRQQIRAAERCVRTTHRRRVVKR